ncbi:hypothetical protein [Phytomonospora endophytica]|uniref:Uncharacterized protein n=1 Tax=Phytomonospora endophytica TaxID=714109 RepID=A0A841FTX2_9ACTN|nr:hypothetical protein [Phytomonospora endophytica]MBB6038233.1 hypothetical protein [Phytomonospora endophytica]GIG67307.1 hypothetical protein Pen01_36020 [Phytomonospora endophytica]
MEFISIWTARIGLATLAAGSLAFLLGIATGTPTLLVTGLAAVGLSFATCSIAMKLHRIEPRPRTRPARSADDTKGHGLAA